MQVITWDKSALKKLNRSKEQDFDDDLFKKVHKILQEVRTDGDLALRRFTKEFDGIDIPLKRLQVTEGDINKAYEKVGYDFVPLLKEFQENASQFYEKEIRKNYKIKAKEGALLSRNYIPLERIGIYVPGGQAPLVSTVFMSALPAKIAGVKEIVLVTPPQRETGEINPQILVVANLLGIKEIYRVGGAQAIAAMAFGTRTIKKVDKIVGPGNTYVTEAKRQVYGFVDIDMVAGPSEVCILADSSAVPNYVTCDLLAQTEHNGGLGILVTNSKKLVEAIKKRVEPGYIIFVDSLEEGCDIVNEIAPEHLEIMTKSPNKYLKRIQHAGAIFVGPYSPAVVGDYMAGPSHVLPTSGTARFFSPLSAATFLKNLQVIHYTKESLTRVREYVQKLTEIEGLVLHRISLEARFVDGEKKS
ncbi:MAG: histidinol dehydrogenase, partial [Candidatus Omnitrophica bacterium]|nr:histidinol dehydrogenase [Candidatus Omnitrophota bacterium]